MLLGGALTSTLGWRWVLFVNVPIGLLIVAATPFVIAETELVGEGWTSPAPSTSTAGMTLLVFGLIHAATTVWRNPLTITTIVVGCILLAIFVVIEATSRHALMPLHLFRSRNRTAVYGITLAIGLSMFAITYFLTLFMQDVLGYGPMKAGVAYLPFALVIVTVAAATSSFVGRFGIKVPLVVGTALRRPGALLVRPGHPDL